MSDGIGAGAIGALQETLDEAKAQLGTKNQTQATPQNQQVRTEGVHLDTTDQLKMLVTGEGSVNGAENLTKKTEKDKQEVAKVQQFLASQVKHISAQREQDYQQRIAAVQPQPQALSDLGDVKKGSAISLMSRLIKSKQSETRPDNKSGD